MPLATFLLSLTLFWAAVHLLHHILSKRSHSSLLPTTTTTTRHPQPRRKIFSSRWQLTLKSLHIRLQTTSWNALHDALASSLRRGGLHSRLRLLTHFYDLGALLGVLGMLASLVLLSVTAGMTLISLKHKLWPEPLPIPFFDGMGGLYVVRRGLDEPIPIPPPIPALSTESDAWITPIIPGVTVPLNHLPFILAAVFLAQVVHEFGHALTAALESIPIVSAGASLTVLIPAAFVSLPTAAMDALPPRARARIIAAGPFHNLVLWLLLTAAARLGLGSMFWSIGFKDVSDIGRVVIGVDPKSPLYDYIPPRSIIIKLDDQPLGSTNTSQDLWTSYLKPTPSSHRAEPNIGWCAGPLQPADQCCSLDASPGLSCFTSLDTPSTRGCLDPIPLLTSLIDTNRCSSTANCPDSSICVRPDRIERLLRLRVEKPSENRTDVVLWSGPREEVWDEVRVGTLLPRIPLLPVSLPGYIQVFVEYLLMGTISLFFFNLLPLPSLDGGQFLETILQSSTYVQGGESQGDYDLEAWGTAPEQRQGPRGYSWWKIAVGYWLPRLTTGLFALCILLQVINLSS